VDKPRRYISSLFNRDSAHAAFVRSHGRLILAAFDLPPDHIPIADDLADDLADDEPQPLPPAKRRRPRRKKGGGTS
jgi:hypothetical protein